MPVKARLYWAMVLPKRRAKAPGRSPCPPRASSAASRCRMAKGRQSGDASPGSVGSDARRTSGGSCAVGGSAAAPAPAWAWTLASHAISPPSSPGKVGSGTARISTPWSRESAQAGSEATAPGPYHGSVEGLGYLPGIAQPRRVPTRAGEVWKAFRGAWHGRIRPAGETARKGRRQPPMQAFGHGTWLSDLTGSITSLPCSARRACSTIRVAASG
jgi:hypothetical protein